MHRPPTMRRASRLSDFGVAVLPSKTTAPRGVDQDLEVSPRLLLVAVLAGVGDGRRQRREQHQNLLVLAGELPPRLLVGEIEVADVHAPVLAIPKK